MMLRVAIIDADLIGRRRHRFPNLACMKLSGYWKGQGADVVLKTDFTGLSEFDQVFISKVFTDTPVPEDALSLPNVQHGGIGFFYDRAAPLPEAVEHHRPDYHLYDPWVEQQLSAGGKARDFIYYTDYSIGFLTRGCFRKCSFCVNQNYDRVFAHSPLTEFFDPERPKICLLDDNFLGHPDWKGLLTDLQQTQRPFQFKQGLDERLLTDEKCAALFSSRYDGDFIFAFDDAADAALIEQKLQLARKHTNTVLKFYCFCGYDRAGAWDADFWKRDIFELLFRIAILMRYKCLPYVMRYARYSESPYRGMYITLARWCNQPSFFKKKSLWEFTESNGKNSACFRYVDEFAAQFPEVEHYLHLKFGGSV